MAFNFFPAKAIPLPVMRGDKAPPASGSLGTLWIGSINDARNVEAAASHNVRLIVNCSKDIPFYAAEDANIAMRRVPVDDTPQDSDTMLASFPAITAQMYETLQYPGHGVLVHCYMGISRSASMCAAFLMYYTRVRYGPKHTMTPDQAIAYVQRFKGETFQPQANFRKALDAWHAYLISRSNKI